jgi:type IV secretion system protein VirB1
MAAAFVDIAQSCAPMVQVEMLAGVVSLESNFLPFAIRINSGSPRPAQPSSRSEAIELATSLIADHQNIQIGLGGIGLEELRKLNLSVSDAFDPCWNLKATATLLDGYYRLALRVGADPARAENVMVKYDEQVRREAKRLSPKLASLTVAGPEDQAAPANEPRDQVNQSIPRQLSQAEESVSWDVFTSRRRSSVLVFQNNDRSEQSE